jgi:predicted nuclease of predicted toxin-antitoxin system
MRLLANENFPRVMVEALIQAGHDVVWIRADAPVVEEVLLRSVSDQRVLITFDKDFGELTFRSGQRASSEVILFRIALHDIHHAIEVVLKTIESRYDWTGHLQS